MQCPSCRSRHVRRIGPIPPDFRFAGRELDQLVAEGILAACRTCHLRFRWPQPDFDRLQALYQQGDVDHWKYEQGSRADWEAACAWLSQQYSGGNLLDVGCFDGGFLRGVGSEFRRFGVEPHPEAAERARSAGIEVIGTTLNDVGDTFDGYFDSVVAFDVIEHLSDPGDFVSRVHRLLRRDGSLVIGSGNTASLTWKFMGSRYWYCAIPEHLSFINTQWIDYIAESNKMKVVRHMRYSHVPNADLPARLSELAKNVLCRTAPPLWRRLRARGFGGIDVSLSERLRDYPPQWMTAKDHILVILRK